MKTLIKLFIFIGISITALNANEDKQLEINKIDCIILEDENSIICKYTHERINENKEVIFNWIEPNGNITRSRAINIPAGHGSVYDFRYIKGRITGEWTLEIVDASEKYETKFIIE